MEQRYSKLVAKVFLYARRVGLLPSQNRRCLDEADGNDRKQI